jgi:hypothetical protein
MTPVANALTRLTEAINHFDRTVATYSDAMGWESAALLLRLAREQSGLLDAAVGAVEARVIVARRADGISGDVPVPGVGVVAVHRARNRKQWDHEGLAGHVLDRHLSDRGDGELPTPWEVRDWLMEAAAIGYWRVGVLKQLGLDADDFCDSTPGHPTVQIISSNAPAAGF